MLFFLSLYRLNRHKPKTPRSFLNFCFTSVENVPGDEDTTTPSLADRAERQKMVREEESEDNP